MAATLLLFGCTAKAASRRASVVLVTDESGWVTAIASPLRDAEVATVVAGSFLGDPAASGFEAHCIRHPDAPVRQWGPTLQVDGAEVTYPDDVDAAALFCDWLVRSAGSHGDRPFFACYVLPEGAGASRMQSAGVALQRAMATSPRRPLVLLTASPDRGIGPREDSPLLRTSWLEGMGATGLREDRLLPEELARMLLHRMRSGAR